MSSTRLLLNICKVGSEVAIVTSPVVAAAAAWAAGSRWKIAEKTQTGKISNTGVSGLFIKTNEMTLQLAEGANGNRENDMNLSLHGNQELIKKAQKFCEEGTFVKVKYDKFLTPNLFKANSSRKVIDIEEVTKSTKKMNSK